MNKELNLGIFFRDSIEVIHIMSKVTTGLYHCVDEEHKHSMILARQSLEILANIYGEQLKTINELMDKNNKQMVKSIEDNSHAE